MTYPSPPVLPTPQSTYAHLPCRKNTSATTNLTDLLLPPPSMWVEEEANLKETPQNGKEGTRIGEASNSGPPSIPIQGAKYLLPIGPCCLRQETYF